VRFRIKDLEDALRKANAKLKDLAEHDDLTGLFNMRSMYSRIDYELRRAKRHGRKVTCVMMDIDRFKEVNDNADHLFGSFVIQEIGKMIVKNIRDIDLAARYGGDEFLIVLHETNEEGAKIFTERLRKVIESHTFKEGKNQIKRTCSFGYAVSDPAATIDARDLVRRADQALFEAKELGRNRTVASH
jgi:diguanylate cyclase (GGDEF)-like protein